ncbi:cytochrome P450 306a1-like [Bicyclus anynana]|uniref:Cytochrome P450 306a1-like n=1 Tax=Bicyclus anynana TaxID=110368 RepID=A0ABM3M7E9_BICAN|nr:cytochrome P450 306a1-like [Bicyclus anynana]XP_052747018.1 cytochrome P450 306a1-like [Bicyclus anynana]
MALGVLWFAALVLLIWVLLKKWNQWKDLPPGPWGLPIVGYLPFLDRHYPHLSLTELSKQYGPVYGIQMGGVYTVVLSDHQSIREAFSKDAFTGRAPLYLSHGITKGNGIICAENALWRDQRKVVTSLLKSIGMIKHGIAREKLSKRISDDIDELIQNIKESCGSPIHLPDMLFDSFGAVVFDVVLGFKFPRNDKTWNWLRAILKEGGVEVAVSGALNFLPFLRFISPSKRKSLQVLINAQTQTHKLNASIIAKRRKMIGLEAPPGAIRKDHANIFDDHPEGFIKCIKYSKHASNPEVHYFDPKVMIYTKDVCMLDNFLIEQKKRFDNGDDTAYLMRDEQLHYLLVDLFSASLDTSTVTFSWLLLYISLYTEIQEKIRQEILTVYPEEGVVDSTKLSYTLAAVCETQRIRTIVPLGVPHGCLQEAYFRNYRIPKGAMIIPLLWAVHMDTRVWKDPESFNPNRFIDENGQLIKPQELITFQAGKRMCPGDELSRMSIVGHIARLLRAFRIRLSSEPPTAEQMKGNTGISLMPPELLYICEPIS